MSSNFDGSQEEFLDFLEHNNKRGNETSRGLTRSSANEMLSGDPPPEKDDGPKHTKLKNKKEEDSKGRTIVTVTEKEI